jgi:hypothetical protein
MFVKRTNGIVSGCFKQLQRGHAEEELPDDHPEVIAFIEAQKPKTADLSDVDNLDKVPKTFVLLLLQYANALQAGTHSQKSVAELKADFKTIYDTLP